MNRQEFINGKNSFPVSTETLNFMQDQTMLVQKLTAIAGDMIIVTDCDATHDGLVIINGELMPLEKIASKQGRNYIEVIETSSSVTANGTTYDNVRKTRYARYTASSIGQGYGVVIVHAFKRLTNIKAMMTQIDELQRHQMPKGAIIMWSGTNVPSGYALCNGQTVGDITTPDLQGRFIVGKGSLTDSEGNTATYNIGSTGGLNKHKLTAAESGLPQHAHTMVSAGAHSHQLRMGSAGTYHNTVEYAGNDDGYKALGDNNYNFVKSAGSHTHTINNAGGTAASQSHENRPPYYALAYIMKVI